jgi:hypothetical protein
MKNEKEKSEKPIKSKYCCDNPEYETTKDSNGIVTQQCKNCGKEKKLNNLLYLILDSLFGGN